MTLILFSIDISSSKKIILLIAVKGLAEGAFYLFLESNFAFTQSLNKFHCLKEHVPANHLLLLIIKKLEMVQLN